MKTLRKYFTKRESAIKSILGKANREYTPGTFHKLRIEIKKLNALFDLLNFCSRDFKAKKMFIPFKSIFIQAGKVRERQLEVDIINKQATNISLTNFRIKIQNEQLLEQDKFYLMVNKKYISGLKKTFNKIAPHVNEATKKKTNRYLEKKGKIIDQSIGENGLETQQVHKMRKQLKMLNYNLVSLLLKDRKRIAQDLDILPDLLGKWNDNQEMCFHLNEVSEKEDIDPDEISQLEKIKCRLDSDNKILFGQINRTIPGHLKLLDETTKQIRQQ